MKLLATKNIFPLPEEAFPFKSRRVIISGDGGVVYFTTTEKELWKVNVDGSNLTKLLGDIDENVAIDKANQKIVYTSKRNVEIYNTVTAQSDIIKANNGNNVFCPQFINNDSAVIWFDYNQNNDLYTLNSVSIKDTSQRIIFLSTNAIGDYFPQVRNNLIMIHQYSSGYNRKNYLYNITTMEKQELSSEIVSYVSLSLDSKKILSVYGSRQLNIYDINATVISGIYYTKDRLDKEIVHPKFFQDTQTIFFILVKYREY